MKKENIEALKALVDVMKNTMEKDKTEALEYESDSAMNHWFKGRISVFDCIIPFLENIITDEEEQNERK